uniref:Uncharacterized protein n=1 Tax=Chenopodium quinoa TaxID=63459 RepID=A0A803N4W2_CHEQI
MASTSDVGFLNYGTDEDQQKSSEYDTDDTTEDESYKIDPTEVFGDEEAIEYEGKKGKGRKRVTTSGNRGGVMGKKKMLEEENQHVYDGESENSLHLNDTMREELGLWC